MRIKLTVLLSLQFALRYLSQAGHFKPNEHAKKLSQARRRGSGPPTKPATCMSESMSHAKILSKRAHKLWCQVCRLGAQGWG